MNTTGTLKLIPITASTEIEELMKFFKSNPWNKNCSSQLVRRFLTELISDLDHVFDLHDSQGRVATAVLLDKVTTPKNDACLEIISLRSDIDPNIPLQMFIELSRQKTSSLRAGFVLALPDLQIFDKSHLQNLGLEHHFDTYEMKCILKDISTQHYPQITPATIEDGDEIYHVLCESFANNLDIGLLEKDVWKSIFLKSPQSRYFAWKSNQEILGYSNLVIEDNKAEVRTLGVLPQHRKLGIGSHLLQHSLNQATSLGLVTCKLTVAVQNQNALGLYLRAGFEIVEKFKCFRVQVATK